MRLVKAPISRNPCVFAPFRCEGRNSSQAARAFVDELPREAFGVRPACWRFRKALGGSKAGASSTHSRRFAQFGYGFAALCLSVFICPLIGAAAADASQLVSVKKIWDAAPHNAFTDLTRFGDKWFCTFREADGHVRGNGSIRVITSTDGERWW